MQFLSTLFRTLMARLAATCHGDDPFRSFTARDWADLPVHHPTCPDC
jgi:hypothetical protein